MSESIHEILGRVEIINKIKDIILHPINNHNAIYIYGKSGIGKTELAKHILKECNYEYILYDASTMRNKNVMEDIAKHTSNYANVMSMFVKKKRQIAFIMDEIDGMNNGDKGGINTLIKLIRQKKPAKPSRKKSSNTAAGTSTAAATAPSDIIYNPIICIANYKIDKKIKELMKICHVFEITTPTNTQITTLMRPYIAPPHLLNYIQSDLRKMHTIIRLLNSAPELLSEEVFCKYFQEKHYNDNTKKTTLKLLTHPLTMMEHNSVINETDRTSVGLLWHENIIDHLGHISDPIERTRVYLNQLSNICLADYIDRITFQKQIWQFNEMSSLIKTMKNNKALMATFIGSVVTPPSSTEPYTSAIVSETSIRFTKVLTKYSTEYNNFLFIQRLCQQLNMDRMDVYGYFLSADIAALLANTSLMESLAALGIKKLDILRIQRFLIYINGRNNDSIDDEISIDEFETDDEDAAADIEADENAMFI